MCDSAYANAKSFRGLLWSKITSQQGVYLYDWFQTVPKKKLRLRSDASFLEAGVIDAYVSERPESMTAEFANAKFKMIQPSTRLKLAKKTVIAIGLRKDDSRISQINASIETISMMNK